MATEDDKIIGASRKEAIELGLAHYHGKPCIHGHGTVRYTRDCHCVQCTLDWGAVQREKNIDRVRERERIRYAKNPEKHINKVKAYYAEHAEEVKAKSRERHRAKSSDEDFKEAARERTRKWAKENPERAKFNAKVSKHKRRALEKEAEGTFTAEDAVAVIKSQNGRCAYCKKKLGDDLHIDHIIALSRDGTNYKRNLQATCGPCNLAKGAKDPIDFARSRGMLL